MSYKTTGIFFRKFSKFWRLGGIFENFKNLSNSFIFNFLEQTNTAFERSWIEEQDSGLIFWVYLKNVIFPKITEIFNFRLKRKNDPRILFLSSRASEWCICLFKNWTWRNKRNFLNFRKFPPVSRISKILGNPQCNLVANKITFRMVYNLLILTVLVMELLPF